MAKTMGAGCAGPECPGCPECATVAPPTKKAAKAVAGKVAPKKAKVVPSPALPLAKPRKAGGEPIGKYIMRRNKAEGKR